MKSHEKVFTVEGINLRIKKLGLTSFPTFKTIYGTAMINSDEEGLEKAHEILLGWLEYEMLENEWVPAYSKTQHKFVIDKLNTLVAADKIINILITDILAPLFQNIAESTK